MKSETTMTTVPWLQMESPEVTDELLQGFVEKIRAVGNPLSIVLFGSQAEGRAHPDSDVDLLVFEEPGSDCSTLRSRYSSAISRLDLAIDLLVFSIDEVASWRNVPYYIISDVFFHGRVLYEDTARMSKYYLPPSPGKKREEGTFLVRESGGPYTVDDMTSKLLAKAARDLKSSKILLDASDPDNTCFHAQQAVEKSLKGLAQFHGRSAPRGHELKDIYRQCRELAPLPDVSEDELVWLSKFSVDTRYNTWPDMDTARGAFELAKTIFEHVLQAVPPSVRPQYPEKPDTEKSDG